MVYLAIFLAIIFSLVIYKLVNHYFSKVITRKTKDYQYLYHNQVKEGLMEEGYFENLPKQEITLSSKDNLKLKGFFIESLKESKKTMILVHGITVCHLCSIKYMKIFLDNGWNVLIYDQRRHGLSEGEYSTYGYYEKEDLNLWVEWVINKKGKDEIVGLHGESMGAATVLQYAAINKYAKFIIADCGFSDLYELLKRKVQEDYNSLLMPILILSNMKSRVLAKFNFKDASPIKVVKKTDIPIMFIHGNKDYFVPWDMSLEMYDAKEQGIKKLYIAEGAAHAEAIKIDMKRYENEVMAFINEVLEK